MGLDGDLYELAEWLASHLRWSIGLAGAEASVHFETPTRTITMKVPAVVAIVMYDLQRRSYSSH